MRTRTSCFGILVVSLLAAACSSVKPGEAGTDIELYYEDQELDKITYENDGSTIPQPEADVKVQRERIGARFAFGGETTRGFFQVFTEDWQAGSSEGLTTYGLGGGMKGTPVIAELSPDVDLILPYRGDLSLAAGADDVNSGGTTYDRALVYIDLHLEAGIGIDWMGFRPSLGLAMSSLGGAFVQEPTNTSDEFKYTLAGTNFGYFLDLFYKYADFPMYGHLRFQGGDYQMTTFGIGVKF